MFSAETQEAPLKECCTVSWSATHGEMAVNMARTGCSKLKAASADPPGHQCPCDLELTLKRSEGEQRLSECGFLRRGRVDGGWRIAHLTCTSVSVVASQAPRHERDGLVPLASVESISVLGDDLQRGAHEAMDGLHGSAPQRGFARIGQSRLPAVPGTLGFRKKSSSHTPRPLKHTLVRREMRRAPSRSLMGAAASPL